MGDYARAYEATWCALLSADATPLCHLQVMQQHYTCLQQLRHGFCCKFGRASGCFFLANPWPTPPCTAARATTRPLSQPGHRGSEKTSGGQRSVLCFFGQLLQQLLQSRMGASPAPLGAPRKAEAVLGCGRISLAKGAVSRQHPGHGARGVVPHRLHRP